ncbi:uncharacterized protein LOC106168281 [Lingula anatina]|uniref:Uncharacterized protein LOC106168111 n=1 Tax=Lingula anatina TaxID=7574 RepID=A0A1S3IWE7_LINAN|nr:uncharacterized protein LOC106168111 [Lingula anatina]XP_013402512.1 uncharacterized protein LOC106168111 [Lingula anatina]XP_013402748.1 uncharacterized protein LOC106168281 [Lingula anatina]XP_013402754.1 uncharacterized protein LOC106168281 [Lingula anatina]|eukprot:XP_013402506.1 uncharacterized protein LOC106168111 [Lingula anatina]
MGKTEEAAARVHVERDKLEAQYKQYKTLINELSQHYQTAKCGAFLDRYEKLKDMIKACYEGFEKVKQENIRAATRSGGLMGAAMALAETERQVEEREILILKYKENSKEEVRALTEKMESQVKDYRKKVLHIKKLIETMHENYEASKSQFPKQRYETMKNIAKSVFSDPNI